jgi:hypothetical protein
MAYLNQICIVLIPLPLSMSNVFFKREMKCLWTDAMKRRILKECRVIGCNIKSNDRPFWWSHVCWIYFFLHMLNYSCANSYLFNRIPWLLISNNITSLYLLSNKDVIRAIYIKNVYAVICFTEATSLIASMEDTPLIVVPICIIVEEILLIVDCGRGQNVT